MGKPHAIVFPIPLQGHINPMLTIAKTLNSSGIQVTFLLTERILSLVRLNNGQISTIHTHPCKDLLYTNGSDRRSNEEEGAAIRNELYHAVTEKDSTYGHHEMRYDTDNENTHGGSNLSRHSITVDRTHNSTHEEDKVDEHPDFKDACIQFEILPDSAFPSDKSLTMSALAVMFLNSISVVRKKLEDILESLQQKGRAATCIISDSFVPWTQDVANKFNIPRIEFWSSSVTVYSMGYHIPHLISQGYLPVPQGVGYNSCIDIIPGLAPFRLVDFFYTHSISSPVFDLVSKAFSRAKESHRVLVNSFYDLEKSIVDALRKEGILIEPIGPLISLSGDESSTHMLREKDKLTVTSMSLYASEEDCLDWLNKQEAGSVIYVSFGSMVKIGKDEIQELIKGLEGSEQPYLLVVRPDMHFMECRETSSRGRVCCWAPQVRVLGHPAVSGFLTHCGWNSIIESICMGVPMIGCPQESEQHTNFKFMRDEWRVAIGLDNWQCLCDEPLASRTKIEGKAVQRAVMNLMRGEDGIQLRERMRNLQQSALSHVRARSTVLQALLAGMQDDHLP